MYPADAPPTDMPSLDRLAVHQVTLLEQCDFRHSIEAFARHEIRATAVWNEKLQAVGVREAARILSDLGMTVTALCPGGLFTQRDPGEFETAIDASMQLIDQAAEIGARSLVVITGGLAAGERDLGFARERAGEGLARLITHARNSNVRLALEPLHPMVCGFRSVISTLREANDLCDAVNAPDVLGIALDTYALWWEGDLYAQIERAGPRVIGYHVSDWLRDTCDVRLDRGMPGDGVIDLIGIRTRLEATGFNGYCEVEIFSRRNWWQRPADEVLSVIKSRFATAV